MSNRFSIFLEYVRTLVRYSLLVREVVFCLIVLILLNGALFSFVEGKDIGSSIYFVLITGLTVGYGDIVPVTTIGRIIAVATAVVGTVFIGLIVAINTRALKATMDKQKTKAA